MPYTIVRRVGSGGFGNVDEVTDEQGNRIACKTFSINQPLPDDLKDNVLKRFVREANVQIQLNHRNIVPVIGHNLDHAPPFYFMPLAESNLEKDIAASKISGNPALACISDIVSGLEEMHSVGIFHRDLKPQNVLRFSDSSGIFYAISDFGFVSIKDSQLSALTTTGMIKGSDYYTAPEITTELRRASAQSDIFSLGCILHDIVGTRDRIPCQEIREDGPYSGILLNSTRQNPSRRFKNVRSFLDALMSIDPQINVAPSDAAKDLIEKLTVPSELSPDVLNYLVDFLESHQGYPDARPILLNLTRDRIEEICKSSLDHANRLAPVFARWVHESGFDFSACDGLALRLEVLFSYCDISAKAECLMAMLELGTSHNRWFVERKFLRLCGPELEERVAKRLAIEFRADGSDVCRRIAHLERSISVSRNLLHPILVKVLSEICQ